MQIMSLYYQGKPINEIAKAVGVSSKSVFTHKYQVMHKYNLQSEMELFSFLNVLADKEMCPISFRDLFSTQIKAFKL